MSDAGSTTSSAVIQNKDGTSRYVCGFGGSNQKSTYFAKLQQRQTKRLPSLGSGSSVKIKGENDDDSYTNTTTADDREWAMYLRREANAILEDVNNNAKTTEDQELSLVRDANLLKVENPSGAAIPKSSVSDDPLASHDNDTTADDRMFAMEFRRAANATTTAQARESTIKTSPTSNGNGFLIGNESNAVSSTYNVSWSSQHRGEHVPISKPLSNKRVEDDENTLDASIDDRYLAMKLRRAANSITLQEFVDAYEPTKEQDVNITDDYEIGSDDEDIPLSSDMKGLGIHPIQRPEYSSSLAKKQVSFVASSLQRLTANMNCNDSSHIVRVDSDGQFSEMNSAIGNSHKTKNPCVDVSETLKRMLNNMKRQQKPNLN